MSLNFVTEDCGGLLIEDTQKIMNNSGRRFLLGIH